MIILENGKRILNTTMEGLFLFFPPTQYNNKLPDQLAFPLKSYALCSEPEPHIMPG